MTVSETMIEGVRYGSDSEAGIRRRGSKRVTFVDERTNRPASAEDVARIRALVIPPAWTDVWISPFADTHIQATGRDAKGRKQYRYHDVFTDSRATNKFDELVGFGTVLGKLRGRVDRDLRRSELSHDRVVATVVRLLDVTSLRIGNTEYARTNESFGLTTLRSDHAKLRGSTIRLSFRGKSAHDFDVTVENPRLSKIVRLCQHLPGQQLFQYKRADGSIATVGSADVNAYLSDHGRPGATAKTFRTWNATVRAADGLTQLLEADGVPTKRALNAAIDDVADHLGNTRTVCRTSYVHPRVIESYLDGTLLSGWNRPVGQSPRGLAVAERRTIRFLRRKPPR